MASPVRGQQKAPPKTFVFRRSLGPHLRSLGAERSDKLFDRFEALSKSKAIKWDVFERVFPDDAKKWRDALTNGELVALPDVATASPPPS